MLIAALTAYATIKITLETLEIFHLLRVGHEVACDGYKAGNSISAVLQEKLQKIQQEKLYKSDSGQQFVQEAETNYDFESSADPVPIIQNYRDRANQYLTDLNVSLGVLNSAKKYFSRACDNLEKMINALNFKDEHNFLIHALDFRTNFSSFRDAFERFSSLIISPPRQLLYIAELVKRDNEKPIKSFNASLKAIDTGFKQLEITKQKIIRLFNKDLFEKDLLIPIQKLEKSIQECMDKPALIPETLQAIFLRNTELTAICTDILCISRTFKQIDANDSRQFNWVDDPVWQALLNEDQQIEVGQRIFLHAMNDTPHHRSEKTKLAEIFLRQHVSQYDLEQAIIEKLAHELANLLLVEQRKTCVRLIQFLKNIQKKSFFPEHDIHGLCEWLTETRHTQTSTELWTKILILPFCLSSYSIESLPLKLKILLPYEDLEPLIAQYRSSHWGTIREKTEQLIQLPPFFKTIIQPNDRFQADLPINPLKRISLKVNELCVALLKELEILEHAFSSRKINFDQDIGNFRKKIADAHEEKQSIEHKNAVDRIKKCHRYTHSIDHSPNILFPYLYNPKSTNELDKTRQVPTLDDLFQVIYKGVDLHEICRCKGNSQDPYNRVVDYFYPNQPNDLRMEAFAYAVKNCRVSLGPLLQLFLSPAGRPVLALENEEKTNDFDPSLFVILKNTEKVFIPPNSLAVNTISSKAKMETEVFIEKLGNYYNLALMRLRLDLHNELPMVEKIKALVQSLLNLGQTIKEERFETVQFMVGKVSAIFSAENIDSINQAINDLKKGYDDRYKLAQKTRTSSLYKLIQNAISGCISEMRCLSEAERKQLQEDTIKSQEQVEILQVTLDKIKFEKEELAQKLKNLEDLREYEKFKMEAQRERDKAQAQAKLNSVQAQRERDKDQMEAQRQRDKAEMAAQLERDKAEMQTKINELLQDYPGQSLTATESVVDTEQGSKLFFFNS